MLKLLSVIMLPLVACATAPQPTADAKSAASQVLNEWHAAASAVDATRYLYHLAPDAVFIGTDATERWSRAVFAAYVKKHFSRGKGWTMKTTSRHLRVGRGGLIMSFDEALVHAKYGALRGSGVLEWRSGRWQIVHYVLSFPIPNAHAKRVLDVIRAQK